MFIMSCIIKFLKSLHLHIRDLCWYVRMQNVNPTSISSLQSSSAVRFRLVKGEPDNISLHLITIICGSTGLSRWVVFIAGDGLSVISQLRINDRHAKVFHQLTLLHARCDGDEGHEAAESQVDPQQGLVEVAGDGVGVVLVHEGEGHGGDGVEEEGGAHHCQVPALVFCCSRQPESTEEDVRGEQPSH